MAKNIKVNTHESDIDTLLVRMQSDSKAYSEYGSVKIQPDKLNIFNFSLTDIGAAEYRSFQNKSVL